MTLPGGAPEGSGRISSKRLIDKTLGKKIVVCARHLCEGLCVLSYTV